MSSVRALIVVSCVLLALAGVIAVSYVNRMIDREEAYENAIVVLKNGHYVKSMDALLPLAEGGLVRALGVMRDSCDIGFKALEQSGEFANLGSDNKQQALSDRYLQVAQQIDVGGTKRLGRSDVRFWYTCAALMGNETAKTLVVEAYEDGLYGIQPNANRAKFLSDVFSPD